MRKFYTLLITLSIVSTLAYGATKTIKYKVKRGDTLSSIASKNGTTIRKLKVLNNIQRNSVLYTGKVLIVKKATTNSRRYSNGVKRYRVKRGDSLYSIASKYKTTVSTIRRINRMKRGEVLKTGRLISVTNSTNNIKFANAITAKRKRSSAIKFTLGDIYFRTKQAPSSKSTKITSIAKTKLGKRYVWGASGNGNTYDCSSFTKYVYKKNGINIPRTSFNQSKYGKYVSRSSLRKGDLIFFDTSKRRKGYVNHVGIYLGNNKFIHASSAKKKVVITTLKRFYSQRYKGARRPS